MIRSFIESNERTLIILMIFSIGIIILITILYYRLKRSYVQLKRNERRKNELIKVLVHDLKSPLDSFRGIAEVMNYLVKTKQFDKIGLISKQIDAIGGNTSQLLKNLLSLYSFNASIPEINKETLNLKALLDTLWPLYSNMANLKNLEIEYDINPKHFVNADKYTLLVIFRNLIDNALKYSPKHAKIYAGSFTNKQQQVEFYITNTVKDPNDISFSKLLKIINGDSSLETPLKSLGLKLIVQNAKINDITIKASLRLRELTIFLYFNEKISKI